MTTPPPCFSPRPEIVRAEVAALPYPDQLRIACEIVERAGGNFTRAVDLGHGAEPVAAVMAVGGKAEILHERERRGFVYESARAKIGAVEVRAIGASRKATREEVLKAAGLE